MSVQAEAAGAEPRVHTCSGGCLGPSSGQHQDTGSGLVGQPQQRPPRHDGLSCRHRLSRRLQRCAGNSYINHTLACDRSITLNALPAMLQMMGCSKSALCVPDRWGSGGDRGARSCKRTLALSPLNAPWYPSEHQTEAGTGANDRAHAERFSAAACLYHQAMTHGYS